MKILLYGHKGWIGSQLKSLIDKPILGNSRLENYEELENEILKIKPDRIISTTGRTHGEGCNNIDYLEDKLPINLRDNLLGPFNLCKICEKYDIHLTYLGTGCIFDNKNKEQKFTEEDKPNFFGSSYSVVKGVTDEYFHNCKILNIRIRMPITSENNPRNFITKIISYDKICSMYNSMTVLPELLPILLDLSKNKHLGTINLTNPGMISHNEILEMYKEIVDPDFTWQNIEENELNTILKSRRSNNYLDTDKLINLYPKIKHIKTSVREILEKYPKPEKKYINLLITGGCGFIGSNFINFIYYKIDNLKIVNIDAMYYSASEDFVKEEIRNSNNYKLIKKNINELNLLDILNQNNINIVIHFAAQSHVCTSFTNPLQYTKDNILGTHNLIESCKKYNKLEKFIHISTDEVYGESINEIKTEQSILCPTNPYAATKAGAELLVQSYIHSYKFPAIITRGNNVYGPNQYPEKLIPKFIKLLNDNKKITIHGDGSCKRSFIHVDDTCNAIYYILKKGKIGEIYNIGSSDELSVLDVGKLLISKILNSNDFNNNIEFIDDRPFNDKRYYIDDNKLKDLGWSQKISFNDGISNLISFS